MEQCIDLKPEIEDESLLGDLNLDGTINIVDIVMLVGVVLGNYPGDLSSDINAYFTNKYCRYRSFKGYGFEIYHN